LVVIAKSLVQLATFGIDSRSEAALTAIDKVSPKFSWEAAASMVGVRSWFLNQRERAYSTEGAGINTSFPISN